VIEVVGSTGLRKQSWQVMGSLGLAYHRAR
jgi:hypothetical protein